jgi:general secretion pathway protein G
MGHRVKPLVTDMFWVGVGVIILVACIGLALLTSREPHWVYTDKDVRPMSKREMLSMSIDTFRLTMGRCPRDLGELNHKPDTEDATAWDGPYLKDEKDLLDDWGREFRYEAPGQVNRTSYDLWSVGPDGKDGTADDLTNFDKPLRSTSQSPFRPSAYRRR